MLLVQQFLENHTFKELKDKHGVNISFSKSKHKFSLNYDQLESKDSDPLACQCRGLILSSDKTLDESSCPGKTEVLAYPMDRFFNYGQGAAANINWDDRNLIVSTKLDGTLAIVYFDRPQNQWCVATRAVPEADILINSGLFTFRTLFEKALKDSRNLSFEEFTNKLDKNHTYCFELTTPYNRVVVDYKDCNITLLAARDISTLKEVNISTLQFAKELGLLPNKFAYNSINELVDWVSTLNPLEYEGVVVSDSKFNRIKLKNAAYVAFNKLNFKMAHSKRNCMEIILLEKDDDVLSALPEEIAKSLVNMKNGFVKVLKYHEEFYQQILLEVGGQSSNNKKLFASLVMSNQNVFSAPLFHMFDGKCKDMRGFLSNSKQNDSWNNNILDKFIELSEKHA